VSPGATLSAAAAPGQHYVVRVPVVTLDEYAGQHGARRIAFIKCALEVFTGAREVLARARPALVFECEQRHLPGSSPQAVFDYLEALGYQGWFFHAAGLEPVGRFRPEIHQPVRDGRYWDAKDYYNNFAFLPKGLK
jgi:hypothetical protein